MTTDPFKTLFVGRINYYTSENKIRREFESYGPIKTIKMVHDKDTGKPKGYCFIEFEHERDMHCKYTKFYLSEHMVKTYSRIVLGSSMDCKCKFHSLGKVNIAEIVSGVTSSNYVNKVILGDYISQNIYYSDRDLMGVKSHPSSKSYPSGEFTSKIITYHSGNYSQITDN